MYYDFQTNILPIQFFAKILFVNNNNDASLLTLKQQWTYI